MVLVRADFFLCIHPLFIDPQIDGMYGNFAGRDASRGMAKQSFDLGMSYISKNSRMFLGPFIRHAHTCGSTTRQA